MATRAEALDAAIVFHRAKERRGTPADVLVVGLGNPGARYAGTRHNVGFDVVDLVASRYGASLKGEKGIAATIAEVRLGGARVTLAEPTTYMNDSGEAVGPLIKRFGIEDPHRLVIVHDELDLPLGRLKVKVGGGLAGHNGLRSIKAVCRTDDFVRVRLGVGKPNHKDQGADHVLKRVPKRDREVLDVVVGHAADAVELIVAEGPERAMERFNGLNVE